MAHEINASEIAELCAVLHLQEHVDALDAAAQAAAEAIAIKLGVGIVNDASTEPGFAGLCVGFGPLTEGQEIPEELSHYDEGSDWNREGPEGLTLGRAGRVPTHQ